MRSHSKAWFLGLFLLFSALSPGRVTSWDTAVRAAVSRALWRHGTVFVPKTVHETDGMIYSARHGAFTSFYGIGQTLVLVPFDMLSAALVSVTHTAGKAAELVGMLPLVYLYAPLVGIFWWLGIARLLEECDVDEKRAPFFATLFIVTTIAIFYVAQSIQEEAIVGAIVTWALVFAFRFGTNGLRRDAVLAGFCLMIAFTFRPTSVFAWLPVAGFGVELLKRDHAASGKLVLFAVLGALPALAVQIVFAQWRFGHPFSLGYDLAAARDHLTLWRPPSPAVFFGMLAGPGKGLLLLSPGLWFCFFGARRAWEEQPGLTLGSLLAVLASLFLHSMRGLDPDGSICWATRYQTHLLGFLALPFAFGFEALTDRKRLRAAIVVVSLVIVGLGFMGSDNLEYLQAEADGLQRTSLIWGLSTGQLGRRIGTVTARLMGRSPSPNAAPEWKSRIDRMARDYTPNLWGAAYARRAQSPLAATAILTLWIVNLGGALLMLRFAVKQDREAESPAAPQRLAA